MSRPPPHGSYSRPRTIEQGRKYSNESNEIGLSITTPNRRGVSVTHLLDFHFPPRQMASSPQATSVKKRLSTSWEPFNKEKFINANYRFIVDHKRDFSVNCADPDAPVEWESVIQVVLPTTKPPSCPICLDHPKAPKVSKCGHVYCWPCILHYLHLGERKWRKCPICYDSIYSKDLKSVRFQYGIDLGKPDAEHPVSLKLTLMKRQSNCAIALPKNTFHTWNIGAKPPSVTNESAFLFSKLLISTPEYVLSEILEQEKRDLLELLQQFSMETEPESDRPFVETALKEVNDQISKISLSPVLSPVKKEDPEPMILDPLVPPRPLVKFGSAEPVDGNYFFYQAFDGQHLYLHPLDIKILKYEFADYEKFPQKLVVDVIHIQESTMTEDLRKRCKYLGHVPLSCDLGFCEVDLTGVVSEETLKLFERELSQRVEKKRQKEKKEEKEEQQRRKGKQLASEPELITSLASAPVAASWEDSAAFMEQFPLPKVYGSSFEEPNAMKMSPVSPVSPYGAWGKSGQSFAAIAASNSSRPITSSKPHHKSDSRILYRDAEEQEDDEVVVDDNLNWQLDLEDAVLDGGPTTAPTSSKKSKKKTQVLLVSNGGKRRY